MRATANMQSHINSNQNSGNIFDQRTIQSNIYLFILKVLLHFVSLLWCDSDHRSPTQSPNRDTIILNISPFAIIRLQQ